MPEGPFGGPRPAARSNLLLFFDYERDRDMRVSPVEIDTDKIDVSKLNDRLKEKITDIEGIVETDGG